MNLTTPLVPGLLLLDEPVSSIDDLNVLALMVFLHKIMITHERQFFHDRQLKCSKAISPQIQLSVGKLPEVEFFRERDHFL